MNELDRTYWREVYSTLQHLDKSSTVNLTLKFNHSMKMSAEGEAHPQ